MTTVHPDAGVAASCKTCGSPIGPKSTMGFCRKHIMQALHARPEFARRHLERAKARRAANRYPKLKDQPSLLAELLDYHPATGLIFWKPRTAKWFVGAGDVSAECKAQTWNKRHAGKEAFTSLDARGYRQGTVLRQHLLGHQVAWVLATGDWPDAVVDHINGDKEDNRIANLRIVSQLLNSRNCALSRNNTSGVNGVSWFARDEKWHAWVHDRGRKIHLGYFQNKADAARARKVAEAGLGYHPNHGRDA